jgi:acyl transferase domain-containing protein/thioesterase domain-containing protein
VADPIRKDDIAIIGMAGRFPGARTLEEFWRNIREGVEAIEEFDAADLVASRVDPALSRNPRYVPRGTVLEDADKFDAAFFGFSPREAEIIDPQQRIFLEVAWEAMEHAGYAGECAGQAVGVYAGSGINTYVLRQIYANPAFVALVGGYQIMVGNDKDFLTTRVSYRLDLRGPSLCVQTACSTSLVAVVTACRALQRGECDMALAGGVAIPFPQRGGYLYEEGMILSPDGHCRPFDESANGIRAGSGAGVVVLKRLEDALADRDTIQAVITGAAVNNDGAGKAGYTAPSVEGQIEAIATAQVLAGADPRTIGYLEAHGTGTPLGDPIEIGALTQVFRAATPDVGFCRLGSLKANLGHLDAAAGVASLIKAVLALRHREFPPLVNFRRPNPQLALESSPFTVPTTATPWPAVGEAPRRAGVSSFGIGGTNSHVVLEEAPPLEPAPVAREAQLLLLSARTEAALDRSTADLATYLETHPGVRLADVSYTLQLGRKAFPHRRALVARDALDAARFLRNPAAVPVLAGVRTGAGRPVAFLFSGQGSQHVGMGQGLYETEPAYRDVVDRCAKLLEPRLGVDLRSILFTPKGEGVIDETRLTQPALFVTELALVALWKTRGVTPSAMVGHSLGEYVAAHCAGVFTLEDALTAVAARGKLMQSMPPGTMAGVPLPPRELEPLLADFPTVEIAAVNAPGLCSVSGPSDAVAALLERLAARGVDGRALHTSHAFHSASMDAALAPFRAVLETLKLSEPTLPYVSNLTGTWITPEQATSPAYYAEHLRRAVRFEDGVRTISADPSILLEVGPGTTLTTLARLTLGKDAARAVSSLAHPREKKRDDEAALESAGRLWLAGADLDWKGLHDGDAPRRIPLPTYPFERKRFWVEASPPDSGRATHSPRVGSPAPPAVPTVSTDPGDWLYEPTWTRSLGARGNERLDGRWLVLVQPGRLSSAVEKAVADAGAFAVVVEPGNEMKRLGPARFRVRPGIKEDLAAVLKEIREGGGTVSGALHLWLVTETPRDPVRLGYHALVALASELRPTVETPAFVLVATEGGACVLDEPVRHPESALALGPVITLPAEIPGLRMRSVDLHLGDGRQAMEAAARDLVAEAATPDGENVVAWRGGRRWVRRLERIAAPKPSPAELPVRKGGAYLVTGGLGGIGLTLAGWLAREYQARLLLTARTSLPPREEWDGWLASHKATERNAAAIRAIRDMEKAGAEVSVAAVDAAAATEMGSTLAATVKRWGRLDGVIHAAGISGNDRIAFLKDDSEVRGVLAPKVDGLAALVQLLGREPLDFVALISSISSIVSGPGQCDYASANAVLDVFPDATSRPAAWKRVLVLNFSAWRDVGMATRVNVGADRRGAWDAMMRTAIAPESGTEAFVRALASGQERLAVTPYDVVGGMARLRGVAPTPSPEEAPREAKPAPVREEPSPSQDRSARAPSYDAPSTPTERKLAAIWSELLGVERVGVNDDWFELGGHSLLATRLFAKIEQATGKNLPVATLLQTATIKHLALLVGGPEAEAEPEPEPESPPPEVAKTSPAGKEVGERSFARLVAFRPQGKLTPLFCVHGAGGNVLNFQDLARHISNERPFYVFQARGIDGRTKPHQSIEGMAEEYLSELRAIQPNGPYFLGGYCGGGLVAYEMAQRLKAAGEQITFLGLIDLVAPWTRPRETAAQRWTRTVRQGDRHFLAMKLKAKVARDFAFISSYLRLWLRTAFGRTVPHELREFWLVEGYRLAQGRYVVKPYDGRVAVFRARDGSFELLEDPGPEMGWDAVATRGVDAREVPGDHDTALLEPNARILAEQLEDAMAKAEEEQRKSAG